ncbi:hypothetical protein LSG23_20295 (plasmid) [Bacillus velezensis]|uniref:hypothetical protein n=1 Tax=Bacillus velezensis TaxID=492670 RepID=UPI001C12A3A7|nr:hypothetical protein [Bacillus velezensis]WNR83253.1 hypothetical protein RP314_20555 [Bacillus velezensis]
MWNLFKRKKQSNQVPSNSQMTRRNNTKENSSSRINSYSEPSNVAINTLISVSSEDIHSKHSHSHDSGSHSHSHDSGSHSHSYDSGGGGFDSGGSF